MAPMTPTATPTPALTEQVAIDASDAGLSDEDADKLKERVTRHIDKGCTVKHTYVQETPVRMSVTRQALRLTWLPSLRLSREADSQ